RTPLLRLSELEAREPPDGDVLSQAGDGFLDHFTHRPIALLDEWLLQKTDVLQVALELARDDALDHLRRLAALLGLHAIDRPPAPLLRLGDLLAADVARARGRHLHRQVAHQLLELVRLGDEVGLAVDLDQHADLAARVDVGPDRPVGGDAGGPFGRLRESLLAQEPERLVEIALRLAERFLTIEEPGARLLAQLLHEVQAHEGCASSSCVSSASGSAPFPPPTAAVAA